MEERDLERLARNLGRRESQELDLERVAAAVVGQLERQAERERQMERRRQSSIAWSFPVLLRVAAALVLFLAGGILFYRLPRGGQVESSAVAVPELYQLSEEQLVEVLDSLALELPLFQNVVVLGDLDEEELRELLRVMEG